MSLDRRDSSARHRAGPARCRSPWWSARSPGWCRSPPRASCRSCPGYLGYVTGLTGVDLEQQRAAGWSPAQRFSSSGSRSSSSRCAAAFGGLGGRCSSTRRCSPGCSARSRSSSAWSSSAGSRAASGSGGPRWRPGRRAGRRAAARRRLRPRLDPLHRADPGRACSPWPPPTPARGRGRGARVGVLPRARRAVPGDRAGLRRGWPGSGPWCAGTSGPCRSPAACCWSRSASCWSPGVWDRPDARRAAAHRRFTRWSECAMTDAGRPHADAPSRDRRSRLGAGPLGPLRCVWRQLTSMRTALFLLLLLAVAAVPGSILPQRGIDAPRSRYLQDHPTAGPWLDRIGAFSVYSSVWFSAIYLLLFVSLVGCLVPRTSALARCAQPPPRARGPGPARPATSTRSCGRSTRPSDAGRRPRSVAAQALPRRGAGGRGRSAAERGHLRELGNLVFHLSLVGLLSAVAAGHLWGWRGDVIVPVGETTVDAAGAYNTLDLGPWVDAERPAAVHLACTSTAMDVRVPASGGRSARRASSRPRSTSTEQPGGAATRPSSVGQPPAGHSRHQGLPARQRLRARHHRPRLDRERSSTPRPRRSCRRTATTARSAWSR